MELGHRLAEAGGVLVPDREARSWHLGRSHVLRRDQVNRYNDAYLANLVPGMRPKRNARGRRYETPYLEVVLAMTGDADEVMGCVDAVLDSGLDDLRVTVDWRGPARGAHPPARRPAPGDPARAPLLPRRAAGAPGGVRADLAPMPSSS